MPELFRTIDWPHLLGSGAYFFLLALVLALLEIQIEGEHGWAAKLPTWRWKSPWVIQVFGKPITGYHVYLVTLILLFLHLSLFGHPWSLQREAELLSFFFLLAVFWDFLWFLLNPHFGWGRFRAGQVWWFSRWWGRFPAPYYSALFLSLGMYALSGPGVRRTIEWGALFAEFALLTAVVGVVRRRRT